MHACLWNEKENRYDDIDIPDKAVLDLTMENYFHRAVCAKCGRLLNIGKTYESEKIYDEVGFRYLICDRCHEEEVEEHEQKSNG